MSMKPTMEAGQYSGEPGGIRALYTIFSFGAYIDSGRDRDESGRAIGVKHEISPNYSCSI
mgnify:CR=1 FL=1